MDELSNRYFDITEGQNATIITLRANYGISVWSRILELGRQSRIPKSKFIIVDFSKVVNLSDTGGEFYILRDELRQSMHVQVLYAGISYQMETIQQLLENGIAEPIRRFPTVEDAVAFIDNPKRERAPGETA